MSVISKNIRSSGRMVIWYLVFQRQSCRLYLEASILCAPCHPTCWNIFVLLWRCLQPKLKYLKIVQKMVVKKFMKINSEARKLSFKLSHFHSSVFATCRRIPLAYKDVGFLTFFFFFKGNDCLHFGSFCLSGSPRLYSFSSNQYDLLISLFPFFLSFPFPFLWCFPPAVGSQVHGRLWMKTFHGALILQLSPVPFLQLRGLSPALEQRALLAAPLLCLTHLSLTIILCFHHHLHLEQHC